MADTNTLRKENKVTARMYIKKETLIEVGVGVLLFAVLFLWGMVQPLTEQPDEHCRFMLPYYIMTKGELPNGYAPELMVGYYGISYGFFPGLPYILMAVVMKLVSVFSTASYALLMAARVVNMAAGVVSYVFVRKLSKRLFENQWVAWLFTLAVSFWPQVLFIFTYVNCDAFAFMSVAIMVYALVRGMKDGWSLGTMVMLSVGVSVCLLSYYNAYGVIVGVAIAFLFSFFRDKNARKELEVSDAASAPDANLNAKRFDVKSCLKKSSVALALCFVMAGWWFIRNAILYEGDFFGMQANAKLAEQYAISIYKPSTKVTLQNSGNPVWCLLFDADFRFLLKQSFFARFGNMTILAPNYIIRGFKYLLIAGGVGLLIPNRQKVFAGIKRFGFALGLVIGIGITGFLVYWYCYANDYQPQGRYLLPALIPLLCLVMTGIQNIIRLVSKVQIKGKQVGVLASNIGVWLVYAYIAATTIGCVYIIWRQYGALFAETTALVFPLIGPPLM